MTDAKKVWSWWTTLRVVAVLNLLLWMVLCLPLVDSGGTLLLQVALSGVYVVVCAYRAWLPRIDLERYCLVDSPWSSMFWGRSAATVAEVCYAGQLALCLHHLGTAAHAPWIVSASYWIIPPLALAQCFCWYSVITLNHLGHAVEESLWAATMALVGVCLGVAATRLDGAHFWFAVVGALLSFFFVVFMTSVDVPMYVRRWLRGRRKKQPYLGLQAGLCDAWSRRVPTREWSVWRPEVAWLTGYFSVAVWISLSFVRFSMD